jgi:hypothetical protein
MMCGSLSHVNLADRSVVSQRGGRKPNLVVKSNMVHRGPAPIIGAAFAAVARGGDAGLGMQSAFPNEPKCEGLRPT